MFPSKMFHFFVQFIQASSREIRWMKKYINAGGFLNLWLEFEEVFIIVPLIYYSLFYGKNLWWENPLEKKKTERNAMGMLGIRMHVTFSNIQISKTYLLVCFGYMISSIFVHNTLLSQVRLCLGITTTQQNRNKNVRKLTRKKNIKCIVYIYGICSSLPAY